MRNFLLLVALGAALAVGCAPQSGAPVASVAGAPPAPPVMIPMESAQAFFQTGQGSVPEEGIPDAGLTGPRSASASMSVSMVPVPGYTGVFNVTLRNTGSGYAEACVLQPNAPGQDRRSTRLNSSHSSISNTVFCSIINTRKNTTTSS